MQGVKVPMDEIFYSIILLCLVHKRWLQKRKLQKWIERGLNMQFWLQNIVLFARGLKRKGTV